MNWTAKNLKQIPTVFELRDGDGPALNSIHWDNTALEFGAYVDSTGTVKERDFGKAQQAAAHAKFETSEAPTIQQQALFGEVRTVPATSKRRKK